MVYICIQHLWYHFEFHLFQNSVYIPNNCRFAFINILYNYLIFILFTHIVSRFALYLC